MVVFYTNDVSCLVMTLHQNSQGKRMIYRPRKIFYETYLNFLNLTHFLFYETVIEQ